MTTRRLVLRGGLAFAAVLYAAAVGAQSPAQQPAIADGTVKLGLMLDRSGPSAAVAGKGSQTTAEMAIEDFGGKVLGAPIELVVADHHNNPDTAGAIARDWFDKQHVDAVLDVAGSSQALYVQRLADTRNRIAIFNAPGATRLTGEACTATSIHFTNDTYAIAHTLGRAIVSGGGDSWFFITADYSYGYDLENETAAVVKANGGTVLGHARHPLATGDFSAYLLQAKQSQAKIIGLADAGTDTTNVMRRAAAMGMVPGAQRFAGLSLRINQVHDLGLQTAQGMLLATAFYWDQDEASRAWSKRFFDRVGAMPNELQAGVYSSTTHYLRAVAKAGTDAAGPVMQAMRATPIDDFFARGGRIRADGVMVHDMYLYEVKTPTESHEPWDYLRLVTTIPGADAFLPLSESKCPLVNPLVNK